MIRKKQHPYSMVGFMRQLILVAVPLVIVNTFISIVSVVNIHRENQETIDNSLSLYLTQTSSKISAIENFVLWTAVEEPLVTSLGEAENPQERVDVMNTLRNRANDNRHTVGPEYQYLAYLEPQDLFFNASEIQMPYADYISIKKQIMELAAEDAIIPRNFTWQTLSTGKSTYIYYLIHYRDFSFGAFITPEDLIEPLSFLKLGTKGYLEITDLNNRRLYISDPNAKPLSERASSLLYSMQTYMGSETELPFNIYLCFDNLSNYGAMLFVQIAIMLSASVLCGVFAIFIFTMYRKVIVPIREFSDALTNPNAQKELLSLESSNVKELEQASVQFGILLREIKKLRIDVYEKELEKERFEITFLQNQIRPHFYLNCLTTIGSMAQLQDYKSIVSMVQFTSNYFRYLFQTDKDMVRLEYELAHIQAYLDIQMLRYGPIFSYTCSVAKEDEQALVLPLLLITFVENSLKHGSTGKEPLRILLATTRKRVGDKDYLQIDISDSGRGFPDEILEKIKNGGQIGEGLSTHIGITNSIQRLKLLYGTDYEIAFTNNPNGGAHVQIVVPLQLKER